MKRTIRIRHLLAFTALAAIAACAATPPSLVVKDLNDVPGDTPIWMNFVQCWEYLLENGGGGREYANEVAISATNYTDKATNALAASTATALGAYLPKTGGSATNLSIFGLMVQPTAGVVFGWDERLYGHLYSSQPGDLRWGQFGNEIQFAFKPDVYAAATAATNYTDESISAANPAFAAAVRDVPITGADASDLAEIAEYGSYGTVGAAILALIAGLAALTRRMGSAETAIANKANAVDLRYALVTPTVEVERRALPANCFPVSFSYNGVSYSVDALVDESEASATGDMFLSAFDNVYSLGMVVAPASGDETMELIEVATFRADGIFESGVDGLQFGGVPAVMDTSPTLSAELSAELSDRASNAVVVDGVATTATLTLPAAVPGFMRGLIADVDNSANFSDLGLQFDGLGMAFALVCPEGNDLAELTSIDAGKLARFYFTETALVSGGLPVIFVQRQTLGAVARTITRS